MDWSIAIAGLRDVGTKEQWGVGKGRTMEAFGGVGAARASAGATSMTTSRASFFAQRL
jgi:hypothetical protein